MVIRKECEYCQAGADARYSRVTTGQVDIDLGANGLFIVPNNLLHYILDHGWIPPTNFMETILRGYVGQTCAKIGTGETLKPIKTNKHIERVGWLTGEVKNNTEPLLPNFVSKLHVFLESSKTNSNLRGA